MAAGKLRKTATPLSRPPTTLTPKTLPPTHRNLWPNTPISTVSNAAFHPRAVNSNPQGSWATTVPLAFINMPILQRAGELRTPALIVHGEKAHSRYFSEDAFKSLGSKNKELYIVLGANHTDLYDNTSGKIPFDKFEQFFKANLH